MRRPLPGVHTCLVAACASSIMACSTSSARSSGETGGRDAASTVDGQASESQASAASTASHASGSTVSGATRSSGSSGSMGSGVDGGADSGTDAGHDSGVDSAFDAGACLTLDAGRAPPSCAPGGAGMTNCGACLESCCTSLEVPGGTYDRTYDLSDDGLPDPPPDGGPTRQADPSTVSALRVDKYPVTVGRFRQFVRAWNGGAGYTPPAGAGKHKHLNGGLGLVNSGSPTDHEPGWVASDSALIAPTDSNLDCLPGGATWTPAAGAQENLPINCVIWQEAYAFCIWDGGFLPSEAEWEYAAAGGSEQREYPWGAAPPGTASQYAIYGCDYPTGTGVCAGLANIARVGTARRGVARWGQLDMAGEIYQWSLDWYAPYGKECADCAYLTTASNRVIRGGYFAYDATYLIPANRGNYPTGRVDGIGLRCARTP